MNDLLDAKFFALSDPTRPAILLRLKSGEASVGELAEPFDMSARAVAKHIAVLEAAGLVTRQRTGQQNMTRLQADALAEIDAWLQTYRALWNRRFQTLGRRLADKQRGSR